MPNIEKSTKKCLQLIAAEPEMLALGARLSNAIAEGAVLFLYGPLGAGKTTLARGFLRGLGYKGKVKSPTYTLVEPYEVAGRLVFHFDFYRLQDTHELLYIGISDYFFPTALCLVEWPEKGSPLLPECDLACYIAYAESGREICLKAHTKRGEAILLRMAG